MTCYQLSLLRGATIFFPLRGAYALAYAALRRSLRGEKLTILTVLRRLTPYLTPPYAGAYAEFHFFCKRLRGQRNNTTSLKKTFISQ